MAETAEMSSTGDVSSGPTPSTETYDPSLLIMVKGKVKKPMKPDDTEKNLLIQKLQAEINRRSDRIKEIKEQVDTKHSSGKGVASGSKELIQHLSSLNHEKAAVVKQKIAIREDFNSVSSKRESLRAEQRTIRDKTRNVNPEELEQKIAENEFKLTHESLSEQEDKRTQIYLQQLLAARPQARQFAAVEARLKDCEIERATVVKRLQDCDTVINSIVARIDAERAALDEVKGREQEHYMDVPALNVEKKENYDIMVACREKINERRKEWDDGWNEYIKLDRAYSAYSWELKKKKDEEKRKEREARVEEYKQSTGAVDTESTRVAYESEIFTCEQLLIHLRSFNAVKEGEGKVEDKVVEAPKGMLAFKKKEAENMGDLFSGGVQRKKQAPKGGKQAPVVEKVVVVEKKDKTVKLTHTLELLKTFLTLGVEVPNTTAEIPATIEKVEAKIVHFIEKRKTDKEAPKQHRAANGHSSQQNGASGSGSNPTDDKPAGAAATADDSADADADSAPVDASKADDATSPVEADAIPDESPADADGEEEAAADAAAADEAAELREREAEEAQEAQEAQDVLEADEAQAELELAEAEANAELERAEAAEVTGGEVTPDAEVSVESSEISGESMGAAVDEKEEGEIEEPLVKLVLDAEDVPVVVADEAAVSVDAPVAEESS